jgi:enamine deaminase RidA (YjgF/YER057c/UK114 family)
MTHHLLLAALLLATALPVTAGDIVRRGSGAFPIASSISVPPGAELVFVSGVLADVADADAPPGSIERLGDTATQTRSVLGKIARELEAAGLGLHDVVKMTVFLMGDPARDGAMDFAGMMQAYREFFGTDAQPKLPARTALQVAALPLPGALVEIEVIAARVPAKD